ncbi:fibronectin type III domain-containing protein [Sediminicola luteus]|nr:fibronectin type III domain-containing protein [Sediminicola luteus]
MKKILPLFVLIVAFSCSTTDDGAPSEPPEITIGEITEAYDEATISWTATSTNSGNLKYGIRLDGNYIASDISETSYTLTGLVPETQYKVEVTVTDGEGLSAKASESFTTLTPSGLTVPEITVSEVTNSGATVTWSASTTTDGSEVSYSIYLNNELVQANITGTEYVFDALDSFSNFVVKVLARSEYDVTTEQYANFSTLGTPPSSFTLEVKKDPGYDIHNLYDPYLLRVAWDTPEAPDGASFSYTIKLNDEIVQQYLTDTATSYVFNDLVEGETYTITVIADSINGTESESSVTFTTYVYPEFPEFEVRLADREHNSLKIDWDQESIEGGTDTVYSVWLDGERITPSYSFNYPIYPIKDLEPDTEYTVTIKAVTNVGFKGEIWGESELVVRTLPEYPAHPTLEITSATLYEQSSSSLARQFLIKFNGDLGSAQVTTIKIESEVLQNFFQNPSTVLTGQLDQATYDAIRYVGEGYVLLEENGTTYKVPFDISVIIN